MDQEGGELGLFQVSKIDSGSINRKILMLLPKPKYNIINAMLEKEIIMKAHPMMKMMENLLS